MLNKNQNIQMNFERSSGILLHVSSLPGKDGIGGFGKSSLDFLEFLDNTNTHLWQVLPLNQTGFGDSPYQGLSAFAGNPLFIDLEILAEQGLIDTIFLSKRPHFNQKQVEFAKVIEWKNKALKIAFDNFFLSKNSGWMADYERFIDENSYWIDNFAVFMTIRGAHGNDSWGNWPKLLKERNPKELKFFIKDNQREIQYQKFIQFLFERQWLNIFRLAHSKNIKIIGDIPIFVGYDCVDVWSKPELFLLDKNKKPTVVAGVPPDFFSKTGQLWGNPLYNWEKHKQEGYHWWVNRIKHALKYVDILRIDHFRGFAGYYEISAKAKTAEKGSWVKGPANHFFDVIKKEIPHMPFIAEDLGVITSDVVELRDAYQLPGMKILQFGFDGGPEHEFMPHNFLSHCVAYTGTHDNNTSRGWYESANLEIRRYFDAYTNRKDESPAYAMIRTLWASVAKYAITPMQDLLNLGTKARMNFPSTPQGNWTWRMGEDSLSKNVYQFLAQLNKHYLR